MSEDNSKYFNTQKFGGLIRTEGRGVANYFTPNGEGGLIQGPNRLYFADGSDALANDGLNISFQHVPSGKDVYFKAFITAFNESYNSDWSEESVFGRVDPIYMFKQTTRKITLSFVAPAASVSEGFENLGRTQKLLSFLYPNYTDVQNALSISQSPLIRLRVMNLASTTKLGHEAFGGRSFGDVNDENSLPMTTDNDGLLGIISSVSVNHNLDNPDAGVFHTMSSTIIPKLLEITVEFAVIHETHLGWDSEDNFSDDTFPYGVDTSGARTSAQMQSAMVLDQTVAKKEAQGIFQELEDERFIQAQRDIAKAMFLNADGSLNPYGKRMQRRLDETTRDPGDRRLFTPGIKNAAKARYMANALSSIETNSQGDYVNNAADVRESGREAASGAESLRQERWSWIK